MKYTYPSIHEANIVNFDYQELLRRNFKDKFMSEKQKLIQQIQDYEEWL